jgi:ABC-2 type transport system permease protein
MIDRSAALLLKYQILSSVRSFASVFYTIVLPLVLFILFGVIFGVKADFAVFFLPGMLAVTTSSDALFAVGPVIKEYYRQGIVREFKSYPLPLAYLFFTFIATRLVFVFVSSCLLVALSGLVFGFFPGSLELGLYALGLVLGFIIYSLLALCISFLGIKDNRDQGVLSLYYFLGMFLSDAYIILSAKSEIFNAIGYIFPLKVVLQLMRGDISALIPCLGWLVLSSLWFMMLMRRMRIKR